MSALRAALGILTRLPVHPAAEIGTGAAAFPLVGALVGGLGAIVLALLGPSEPTVAAFLAVGVVALVTGGLHLDGLADTVDALLAPDPARAEAARKDPRIGAGGAVALIVVVGTEVAALSSLAATETGAGRWFAPAALVAAAAVGRAVPVIAVALDPRARGGPRGGTAVDDGGFGAWFRARVTRRDGLVAAASAAVLVAILTALTGEPVVAAGSALGGLIGIAGLAAIAARRGRLDGDGFGAAIEVATAAVLVTIAVLG